VITVSHSFIATANAIRYCGAVPVFVDVQPHTYNIDPDRIAQAISPKTRAIIAVHQLGMPCDMAAILAVARPRCLFVIEDAACAAGSEILWQNRWERIGRPHGDIACFSFHPRKVMTTGDGGMLTTSNAEWNQRFRLWRQHAMSVSDAARHASSRVVHEEYSELGFNYRMTDLQAAIGRVQLARLPGLVDRRRAIAQRYRDLLTGVHDIELPHEPAWARSNYQSFCVRLPAGCEQSRVMQAMLDDGIATRRGVMCAHLEPAYAREPWRSDGRAGALACSEEITADGLMLPLYADMADADQVRVAESLIRAVEEEDRRLCP
jgi:dTDP-4-amino-4,6-dideoxygalactose transaminase